MDVSKIELAQIEEIKILSDVILKNDSLQEFGSNQNVHVEFKISGDIFGKVVGYLCFDRTDLNTAERNYLFPLFTETMNILIGKQISHDQEINQLHLRLSPPQFIGKSEQIQINRREMFQSYYLETEEFKLPILLTYQLERIQ